jgi:formamidopyrimidine-DNA glycosylase
VKHLRSGIKTTLGAALDAGGTTLGDLAYLLPDRRAGGYLPRLRVYGREGEPCKRCGMSIRRATIRARSTFWCPNCQR